MGRVTVRKRQASNSSAPAQQSSNSVGVTYLNLNSPGVLSGLGYHRLLDAPEVAAAIGIVADLVSSMPIHLMENRTSGDVRIHDQLARKVDVEPWSLGTRQLWIQWIVENELASGNAVVVPQLRDGLIQDLPPVPGATLHRDPGSQGYYAMSNGAKLQDGDILHFRFRPDPDRPWLGVGVQFQLEQVVDSIIQTAKTKTAYMSSEYKPPIIVAVNSDTPLSSQKERDAFTKRYLTRPDNSAPLIIPGDLMKFEQVKPLSLTDLAIKDGVELDKKTVASIIGVPPFLLGVGSFNKEEYNTFISRRILPICRGIEQELTKKLLVSTSRYFRFNPRALYSYTITELAAVAKEWRGAGLMTGNEARNWIDLSPKQGLDDLVMLENYIPASRLGDQNKLVSNKEKEASDDA